MEQLANREPAEFVPAPVVAINGLNPYSEYTLLVEMRRMSDIEMDYIDDKWVATNKKVVQRGRSKISLGSKTGVQWMETEIKTEIKLATCMINYGINCGTDLNQIKPNLLYQTVFVVAEHIGGKMKEISTFSFPSLKFIAVDSIRNKVLFSINYLLRMGLPFDPIWLTEPPQVDATLELIADADTDARRHS
ncbi:hypothetical protein CAEBREN_06370 [Caenorhabditis brenneri]|uniref:T-box domain-containing protein n=1 Tax=Caenorhabditis brenneri TaxID=135651 RepID=G0MYD8_CAEBE|nr:hypothetical protein CAEBREN_06370 [Caenorhabditis brenneri]